VSATEEEVLGFVRSSLSSVWELEVLLLLHGARERSWNAGDINRTLRASKRAVELAVSGLKRRALVNEETDGCIRYNEGEWDALVAGLVQLSVAKPFAIFNAISDSQLQNFSDAFRFKG